MHISSVLSDDQLNLDTSSLGIKSFDLPNNVNFTVENVYKHLSDLHGNWSIGPDGLSGELLISIKKCYNFPPYVFCLSVRLKKESSLLC